MSECDAGLNIQENSLQLQDEGMGFNVLPEVCSEESLEHQDENISPLAVPLDLAALYRLGILNGDSCYVVKYMMKDGKQTKLWQCKVCAKEFNHQYTFMRHFPIHTGERRFLCTICGKAFRQLSTLSQHRAIHSKARPYSCEVCRKTFNRVSSLISHRKTHTGVKPHQCNICNKGFHQKGNLRNHIYTHTNERPYKCDICAKGFNQLANLACHKLKSHEGIDKPSHVCKICGMAFTKRILVRQHEQDHHLNSMSDFQKDEESLNTTVFVEPIKSKAIQLACASNQSSFVLLKPLNGTPVFVKVLPAVSDKQMLVPPSADELKKFGKIYVTPKIASPAETTECSSNEGVVGSTVQIQMPIVANLTHTCHDAGTPSMPVVFPGALDQTMHQEFFQRECDDLVSGITFNS